jgi:8-oxo-dGTP pyrophosphatase MutT (NUDIX family)
MQPLQKFDDCIAFLIKRMKLPLPGLEAQLKLAPPFRNNIMPKVLTDYRKGSVMLLIKSIERQPHLIFIERSDDGKVHSGQIAFPGGKKDESDETLLSTAIRETEEEIGLAPHHISVLGELTQLYIPPSNFMVSPFVGYLENKTEYAISTKEVKRAIEIPLVDFFNKEVIVDDEVATTYRGPVSVPCYKLHGIQIWGASSMILSEFLALFDEIE